jgi:hypothetical protein
MRAAKHLSSIIQRIENERAAKRAKPDASAADAEVESLFA